MKQEENPAIQKQRGMWFRIYTLSKNRCRFILKDVSEERLFNGSVLFIRIALAREENEDVSTIQGSQ